MSHVHASFGLVQAGHERRYVSSTFETNLEDLSSHLDPDLRVEVLGSVKGMGISGSGAGSRPSDILVGKRIGSDFIDNMDRYMVRLYRIG